MSAKMMNMLKKALAERTTIDFSNEEDVAFITPLLKKAFKKAMKSSDGSDDEKTEKIPKAHNSYMEFCKDARKNTDFSEIKDPKDVSRRLGEMWRELSDEEKEVYKTRASANKDARSRSASPVEVKAKRPLSAYIKFCGAKRAEVSASEKNPQDVSRRLGEMWNALSDDVKQKWKTEIVEEAKVEEVKVEEPKDEKKTKKAKSDDEDDTKDEKKMKKAKSDDEDDTKDEKKTKKTKKAKSDDEE